MTQDTPTPNPNEHPDQPYGQPQHEGQPQQPYGQPQPPVGQPYGQPQYDGQPASYNQQQPYSQANYGAQAPTPVKQKNTLGLVALITAIVGFIFACIPGALIIGWILLPIAFILSLVSLFIKGKTKGLGIAALVISVLGTIVGVIIFAVVVGSAVDEALSGGDVTVTAPETAMEPEADVEQDTEGEGVVAEDDAEKTDEANTRANPFPIGTAAQQGDWEFTLNGVTLDATPEIMAENEFNEAPEEGMQYLMANVTVTYLGTDAEGSTPWTSLEYVTADGNTINSYDSFVVSPEEFDSFKTLYEGASTTGNESFTVPADSAGDGVLAVTIDMFGDKLFFAVK